MSSTLAGKRRAKRRRHERRQLENQKRAVLKAIEPNVGEQVPITFTWIGGPPQLRPSAAEFPSIRFLTHKGFGK